jgi:quinol monooxygenase YgiN
MTLRVIAHARAQEGKRAELEEVFEGLVDPTRAEPGNIRYELLASLDDELRFTFVEEWQDREALDAHLQTPHITAANARLPELLDGEVDLRMYRLIR